MRFLAVLGAVVIASAVLCGTLWAGVRIGHRYITYRAAFPSATAYVTRWRRPRPAGTVYVTVTARPGPPRSSPSPAAAPSPPLVTPDSSPPGP